MSIQLDQDAEARILRNVREGLYASTDAAIQLLDAHDQRVQRLRGAIAEGLVGEAISWTPELMEQLTREAEEMDRCGGDPDPDVCA
ncbi:MAG: hypothetical protein U0031_10855 [Thermomicrobiales bacterium]